MDDFLTNAACTIVVIIGIIVIIAIIKKAKDAVKREENKQFNSKQDEFNHIKSLRHCNDPAVLIGRINSCDDSQVLIIETCLERLEELAEEQNNDAVKLYLSRRYLKNFADDMQSHDDLNEAYYWLKQAKASSNHEIADQAESLYNSLDKMLQFNPSIPKPDNWDGY